MIRDPYSFKEALPERLLYRDDTESVLKISDQLQIRIMLYDLVKNFFDMIEAFGMDK